MSINKQMAMRLERFRSYWNRSNKEAPVSYCPGNYYVSKRYDAARGFLANPGAVSPEMLRPEDFMPDYLRIHAQYEAENPDIIYTATPFIGLPWMEAFAGCRVASTSDSFISERPASGFEPGCLPDTMEPRWFTMYLQFTKLLAEAGGNRFAVGQPILRGPCDLAGALLGQQEMVYLFYDEPERMKAFMESYPEFFLTVIAKQKTLIPRFFGGESIGFYDLWCPEAWVWFQDDLTSLLSPALVNEFVYGVYSRLASAYPYSLMHLHPGSFHILDLLLTIENLRCIQVNKDIGGPSVVEMLPFLKQIQLVKNLVIAGDFTREELDLLRSELPAEGVYYICLESPDETCLSYRGCGACGCV